MCDTIVVVRPEGVLFAKNSDRDPNEAQLLEWHPAQTYASGTLLRCTWLTIPQAKHTHALIISRPFWMWGAEIGANEHGVTIGNEAVFGRVKAPALGLTGMDLLRLALERSGTACAAVDCIRELAATFGQGGNAGHEHPAFRYFSSFIIADPHEAWVLETMGHQSAVERVTAGARTISNGLSIRGFRERMTDPLRTFVARAERRRCRTQALAAKAERPRDLMAIVRDHGGHEVPQHRIVTGGMHAPCMHAGALGVSSQTTASWVAHLSPRGCRHWATATSAPCLSVFKPVHIGESVAAIGEPTDQYSASTLWWRHERLHRLVMRDWRGGAAEFAAERDALESRLIDGHAVNVVGGSESAFEQADRLLALWTDRVASQLRGRDTRPLWLRRYWRARDRAASLKPAVSPAT